MKKEAFAFMLFIFYLTIFLIGVTADTITGDVITGDVTSDQVSFNITITGPARLTLVSPENKTYINNESLGLYFTAGGEQEVWYNLDNGNNITLTASTSFNTTKGSHTLYLFANNTAGNITSRNVTFDINLSILTILYDEFKGDYKGDSTDFYNFSYYDLQNLSDIILEHIHSGKIMFLEEINLTDDADFGDGVVDIDQYVNISFNRIDVDSDNIPNFDKPATLFFYNLTFDNPRITRDGVVCPSAICVKNSYSDGTLSFNVTHFTSYSAEETPAGDTSTSSGGGGGRSKKTLQKNFSIDQGKIKITLKRGETEKRKIRIKNTGDTIMKIELENRLENFIKISETSFDLNEGELKTIFLEFKVGEDTPFNLYFGRIIVKGEGIEKEILIALEVESEEPLFDVKVEIPENYLLIRSGENIQANIKLFELRRVGRVDVEIEYSIRDVQGNIIMSDRETIAVEKQADFVKSFKIPENVEEGDYTLYVRVIYDGKTAGASEFFQVGQLPIRKLETGFSVLSIILVIFSLIIFYEIWKIKKK